MGKKQIESFMTVIRLISRQSIGNPTRNHRFDTFMDFEQSKRSGWLVISEFVGTYNWCWSFDINVFHDIKRERNKSFEHPPYCKDSCYS